MTNISKKAWVWIVVVVAVLAVVAWFWWAHMAVAPSPSDVLSTTTVAAMSGTDTTNSISQELQNVNIPDPSQDLQSTNAAVNSL
ncbi:hypothetical protein KGO95_03875 [Patescibacteria group bacterium]|nr:hypothetical protein [Patescibacteria group bacterium]